MGRADYYLSGGWNLICDECGKKRKQKDIKMTWDGRRVCKDRCWEYRHPQDFVKGVMDWQQVPFSRPDTPPEFTVEAQALVDTNLQQPD